MTAPSSGRQASIDVLRAVAIALMVVVHFVENLSARYDGGSDVFAGVHRMWWLPTGFAAATFTFLSGISYRLWLEAQVRRERCDAAISRSTIRRGLFLIGLGFAFNLLVWLPEGLFNWDILTLIGCSFLALGVARRTPEAVVAFAAFVIVAIAPAMRVIAGYGHFWAAGFYDYEFTVSDIVLGWLVTGYFPIFPWLAYPLFGFAIAPWQRFGDGRLMLLGGGLVMASIVIVVAWPWIPSVFTEGTTRAWSMFPASTAYVVGTLGGVCIALGCAQRVLDGDTPRCQGLTAWATPLSRHALSMYLLHHVVHIWPLWLYGYATIGEATALWQIALPLWASVSLAAGFLVAAAILCRLIERFHVPTAESLMRRACD